MSEQPSESFVFGYEDDLIGVRIDYNYRCTAPWVFEFFDTHPISTEGQEDRAGDLAGRRYMIITAQTFEELATELLSIRNPHHWPLRSKKWKPVIKDLVHGSRKMIKMVSDD